MNLDRNPLISQRRFPIEEEQSKLLPIFILGSIKFLYSVAVIDFQDNYQTKMMNKLQEHYRVLFNSTVIIRKCTACSLIML